MNARAGAPGLRPFLPADAPLLAEIFRSSVATLAADHYSEDQLAAWIAVADDEENFARRLAGGLTLLGLVDGDVAGFASLKDGATFDMLYVSPHAAGRGVGAALANAIEKLAEARGATRISVEASDAARDFFTKRGYVAQRRNVVILGDEWLANTSMIKEFAQPANLGRPQ